MKHEIGFKGVCLRAAEEGDGRTLEGVAVPYGSVISTWDGAETFDADCVFDDTDTAKLCYQHGELIGRITGAITTWRAARKTSWPHSAVMNGSL